MSDDVKASIVERYGGKNLLTDLINRLGGSARNEILFGNPVEREGVTVIPVARVRYGLGFGFGGGSGSEDNAHSGEGGGGGGGGGVIGDPVGFIEITKSGTRFVPIALPVNRTGVLLGFAVAAALAYLVSQQKRD